MKRKIFILKIFICINKLIIRLCETINWYTFEIVVHKYTCERHLILFYLREMSTFSSYIRFFLDLIPRRRNIQKRKVLHDIPDPFDLDYIPSNTTRAWFIVLSRRSLIPRDRNLDWGYPHSLPISTFRHSRTRDKSSPWVIARRVSTCARINVLDVRAVIISRSPRECIHYARFNIESHHV